MGALGATGTEPADPLGNAYGSTGCKRDSAIPDGPARKSSSRHLRKIDEWKTGVGNYLPRV